ncbi:MAG TPA: complex I NDUFA9 subunit family protein [Dehalococcoidia bacterium]|nr:complex I NDUFA9 subunit family protein [Dehalococcoidia bacterium]
MILVAGGTGFVGGAIVRELARRGASVAVLSREPARHADRFPGLNVEYRKGDVTDPASLSSALIGIEVVISSQQFPNSPIEDPKKGYTFEKVDAEGTENLMSAAKQGGVRRLIYLSGAGAAPDAPYHWFRAKWRAETAVRDSGITYTIIRPSWVYGPDDVALNRFLGMSRFLPFVPLIGAAGKQRLQPVFIDDVARAVAGFLEKPAAENKVFEMGGPDELTMREIVSTALNVAGRRRLMLAAPKTLMKLLASVLQFAPGRPLTPAAVDFITMDALADPSEIEAALDIKMTPLRDALATYLTP